MSRFSSPKNWQTGTPCVLSPKVGKQLSPIFSSLLHYNLDDLEEIDQTEKRNWGDHPASPESIDFESNFEKERCIDKEETITCPDFDWGTSPTNKSVEHFTNAQHPTPETPRSPKISQKDQEGGHSMHLETALEDSSPESCGYGSSQTNGEVDHALNKRIVDGLSFEKENDVEESFLLNQSPVSNTRSQRINVGNSLHPRDVAADAAGIGGPSSDTVDDHHEKVAMASSIVRFKENDMGHDKEQSRLSSSPSFQQAILRNKSKMSYSPPGCVDITIDHGNNDVAPRGNVSAAKSPMHSPYITCDERGRENANTLLNSIDCGSDDSIVERNTANPLSAKPAVISVRNELEHADEEIELVGSDDESDGCGVETFAAENPINATSPNECESLDNANTVLNSIDCGSDDSIVEGNTANPLSAKPAVISVPNELEHGDEKIELVDRDDESDGCGVETFAAENPVNVTSPNECESLGENTDDDIDTTDTISHVMPTDTNADKPVQELNEVFEDGINTCSLQAIKVQSCLHMVNRLQNADYISWTNDELATELAAFPNDEEPICQLQFLLPMLLK